MGLHKGSYDKTKAVKRLSRLHLQVNIPLVKHGDGSPKIEHDHSVAPFRDPEDFNES